MVREAAKNVKTAQILKGANLMNKYYPNLLSPLKIYNKYYKNRMGFPRLDNNPVRHYGDKVNCSICKKEITYEETNQLWISLPIGTDIVPLLVNSCSKNCENALPKPPDNYVQFPHKGGSNLKQPPDEDEIWEIEMAERDKG